MEDFESPAKVHTRMEEQFKSSNETVVLAIQVKFLT
jgi:hypothetical protein